MQPFLRQKKQHFFWFSAHPKESINRHNHWGSPESSPYSSPKPFTSLQKVFALGGELAGENHLKPPKNQEIRIIVYKNQQKNMFSPKPSKTQLKQPKKPRKNLTPSPPSFSKARADPNMCGTPAGRRAMDLSASWHLGDSGSLGWEPTSQRTIFATHSCLNAKPKIGQEHIVFLGEYILDTSKP